MNTLVYQLGNRTIPVSSQGGTWKLTPGLEPYRGSFLISGDDADFVRKNLTRAGTLVFSSTVNDTAGSLSFKNVFIRSLDIVPEHKGLDKDVVELILQDSRFLLAFNSIVKGYNLVTREGIIAQESVRNTTSQDQDTVKDGRWTYIQIIEDIGEQIAVKFLRPVMLGALAAKAEPLLFQGQTPKECLGVIFSLTSSSILRR